MHVGENKADFSYCVHPVTQVEYIQAPLVDILIDPGASGSHLACGGFKIDVWELSDAEHLEIDAYVREQLGGRTIPIQPPAFYEGVLYNSEAETNDM